MLKRRLITVLTFFVLIPAIIASGYFLLKDGQYYIVSLLTVLCSMFPFFYSLERKKLQLKELVITASVIAIAVASRALFFFLPQVKPMCALLTVSAISFGAEFGFISGALTMLLSNFFFGQGMWTPFQMFGMGMTVFLCAALARTFKIKNRFALGVLCTVLCFTVYGTAANLSSALMISDMSFKAVLSVYASGLPFDLIHALTSGAIVALIQPEINEKLERIKIKYGLFGEKE